MDTIRANGWKIFIVVASVLTALAAHLELFPWMPTLAQHWLELLSFVVTVIYASLIDPNAKITFPEPKKKG